MRSGLKVLVTYRLTLAVEVEHLRLTDQGAPGQNHSLFARDGFNLALGNPGSISDTSRFATVRLDWRAARAR